MYSKKEIIENKKIEEAIHENHKKHIKEVKINKFKTILDIIIYFMSCATFLLGLMFLIAVVEGLKF